MKKFIILITGGAISNNEGAAAMTLVAIELINKVNPKAQIILTTPYLEGCSKRNRTPNIIINPLKKFNFSEYRDADLIIDVSGDILSDDYGILNTIIFLKNFLIPILLKKPIILFPQSIGPFNSKITKYLAKFVFNRCKAVIPRERITYNLLKDMKIKTISNIIDDSAFLLIPISKKETDKIMMQEKIIKEKFKPLIGISLSQSIVGFSKEKTTRKHNEYVKKMVSLVDYLTSKQDANLIFIPHVGGDQNKKNDDRIMCNLVYSKAKDKNKIRIMQKKRYLPQEFKGVISKCDLFIGSRMHANIAALSTDVPTIAIAYSHKTYGIMERFNQQKYVCDIMNLKEDEIIFKIEDALKNKSKIIKQLVKKNDSIKGNEKILVNLIKNALKYDK